MCKDTASFVNDDGKEYHTQPHCVPGSTYGASPLTAAPAAGVSTEGRLIVESFPLTFEGYTYAHGHIAYVEGRPPAPVIQVQHNYAGLKQFDIDQACFLARCGALSFQSVWPLWLSVLLAALLTPPPCCPNPGYVGLAVDLYREHDIIGDETGHAVYAFEDRDPKRDLGGDYTA